MGWAPAAVSVGAATLPFLLEKLFPGSKSKMEQVPGMTEEQKGLLGQTASGLKAPMQTGMDLYQRILSGDPEAMQAFEAPLMSQFHDETVPELAHQFTGAHRSSAFGQQLGQAGASLSERLGAMRAELKMKAMQGLSGMYGQTMGARQFENVQHPAQGGMGQSVAPAIGQAVGSYWGARGAQAGQQPGQQQQMQPQQQMQGAAPRPQSPMIQPSYGPQTAAPYRRYGWGS